MQSFWQVNSTTSVEIFANQEVLEILNRFQIFETLLTRGNQSADVEDGLELVCTIVLREIIQILMNL